MGELFYLLEGFFFIGIVGTAFANRSAVEEVRKERWLKLFIHFIIVHILVFYILYFSKYFYIGALLILIIGLFEIGKYVNTKNRSVLFYCFSFLIYAFLSCGFYLMTKAFSSNILLYIFMIVFVFDGFSQISGQIFGKTKIFPRVSPGKTLEGLIGGAIIAMLTAYFIGYWIEATTKETFFICFILIISSVAGDWMASFYKRKHGIKDFSKLIPGHGGVLDRFDSWIAAGALFYYLTSSGMLHFGV